jgi:hypothetical protein
MHRPSTARPARRRRPFTLLATVLLAASLGLAGCGSASDSTVESADAQGTADNKGAAAGRAEEGPAQPDARQPGGSPGKIPAAGSSDSKPPGLTLSHIIRTAALTVRVKDVPAALDEARTAAENAGGYIGNETTDRDSEGREQSRIVLRVPQAEYESVLDDISGTGKLLERTVDAKDVTDQVVDVESRIKSQEASVARVRELMDRATQLSDIVTLEGELSTRQAELEALKAQQQSLEERTSMATITLVLSETEPTAQPDDETGFTDALAGGWNAFVTTVRWVAVAVGAVLPFAVALALLVLLWRLVRRWLPQGMPRTPGIMPAPPAAVPAPPGGPGAARVPAPVPAPATAPAPESREEKSTSRP